MLAFGLWGDFAAKQNDGVDGCVASGKTSAEAAAASPEAALKGMAEMSARFREKGAELYLSSDEVKND